ncbi:MAG: hypothetical protein K9L17_09275 [Clostridiales bacterium]|nr:hypothetical protein [Clostridiales bacterium]MCF8022869.1 hypothetical protein [Clostridiales bacterium]
MSSHEKNINIPEVGGNKSVSELVKVDSIEEANRLLQEGLVFLAVFYNQALGKEEYVLGKQEDDKNSRRPIGFGK